MLRKQQEILPERLFLCQKSVGGSGKSSSTLWQYMEQQRAVITGRYSQETEKNYIECRKEEDVPGGFRRSLIKRDWKERCCTVASIPVFSFWSFWRTCSSPLARGALSRGGGVG